MLTKQIVSGLLALSLCGFNLAHAEQDSVIVAGGCFWCVESDFEKLPGVVSAESGYTGGFVDNPTYKSVSYTETGHYEAVKIIFDSNQVSLADLLGYFWKTIDPTDDKGQFCDKGSSYRTALFYQSEAQQQAMQASLQKIQAEKPFPDKIVTPILAAKTFYSAEEYHQDYYKKNPVRYQYYRWNCGRDTRLKSLWGEGVTQQPK